jgi:predicted transcriptional regulator with HTH domain
VSKKLIIMKNYQLLNSKHGGQVVYSMDETDRIKIRRLFNKRRVMKATFSYLFSISSREDISSRQVRAKEIADKIGASRTSVLGALRGNSTGYKKEESLEHFGLVAHEKKTINQNSVVVYGLTAVGLTEKELAENQGDGREEDSSEVAVTEEG